ncbi:TIGR02453 family protein [Maribacter sedimenticola]|uniref:TIGR02453 family protein n=2 Tax=Maribacter sedimenticola TaxID=228956 RepID=A0ABY1SHS9_9FLAO|nr:TIGR02453 family protein [Maribacter sedimenticola]
MVNFSLKSQELGRMLETNITKSTFQFLKSLQKNNNRDWFAEHKKQFNAENEATRSFFGHLLELLSAHDEIERLKVFRIYRDVRFSKNKTPYKNSFSASYARAGLHRRGGYYVHLEPGNSFIATGFWNPEKDDLLRIRKEWELDVSELEQIINKPQFKKVWGPLTGDELKTAPKGFDKEDPNIDFIRKKQFVFTRKFTDAEVLSDNFAQEINTSFKIIRPYFDLMSSILTTNLNGESLLD